MAAKTMFFFAQLGNVIAQKKNHFKTNQHTSYDSLFGAGKLVS